MTAVLWLRPRAERIPYVVERSHEPAHLRALLLGERLFAAYALAQLEGTAFPRSEWWLCETGEGVGMVCHSRAGLGDATLTLGPAEAVAAILSLHPGGLQTFLTARPEQLPALEPVYTLAERRVMRRMAVTAERFAPREGRAMRLRGRQVAIVNRLYSSEGQAAAYLPRHLEEGCYYGVIVDGRLVAIAGTHAISPSEEIAIIGNVFTHPQYRGRGYATQATSAATSDLLQHCKDVVLSVDPANTAAVESYRHLGYRDVGAIIEAAARRRASGMATAARRVAAAYRGRRDGVEVVWRERIKKGPV